MNNDDSFNDSDELFSLYSSKKVTDTFKAQLKKIAADKHYITIPYSNVNNEGSSCKKIEDNENNDIPTVVKEPTTEPEISESFKVIQDDLPIIPIESDEDFCDDSIEIVAEVTPTSRRRSERLQKKRRQNNCGTNQVLQNPSGNKGAQGKVKGQKRKKQFNGKSVQEVTIEDSVEVPEAEDELNPELSVKVIWKSVNLKKFQIRKFQKLSYIFELLSREENIPEDKIMLTFNNVRVSRNDTPDSLKLQVYHFLDGGVLSELSNSCHSSVLQNSESSNNSVCLKFQDINKKIIKLNLCKNEKLKVGMIKCSEQLEIPLDKIRFYFDGELLEPSETPESLGLENDEVIDIKMY